MNEDNNSGASMHDDVSATQNSSQTDSSPVQNTAAATGADDHANEKLFAIVGYILPFLFSIPMLQDSSKNDPFARFHANQQLVLLVIWVGIQVVSALLWSMMFFSLMFLTPLLYLALLVLAILGIIGAAQGEMKPLPVVGQFQLLSKLFK